MTIRPLIFSALTGLAVATAIMATTGCPAGTGAQVNAADAIAEDWTSAVCNVAEGTGIGAPYVDLVCSGILVVEGTIGQLTAEGGILAASAPATRTIRLRHVPADQAAIMLARYKK